jgi:hypothetical protein
MADFPLPGPLGYLTSLNNNLLMGDKSRIKPPCPLKPLTRDELRASIVESVATSNAAMFSDVWEGLLYRWNTRTPHGTGKRVLY